MIESKISSPLAGGHKPIQSFVRREGRMSSRQRCALKTLEEKYGIDFPPSDRKRILEIGFGMGHSLLTMALANPDQNFIGVEVYRTGVGNLLANLEDQGVMNVRVLCADAVVVLEEALSDNSLDRVQLFFPDPWPKKRHHKRRLLQTPFAEKIADKLKSGGVFHMATDWENYAEHMLVVLSTSPHFINSAGLGQFAERPSYRPLTKYEQRGQALGHGVWDLLFIKK